MIDEQKVFERVMRGFVPPDDSLERLVRRRDRKRRNQRIAAGVVGIAVFVAAVWIVTSGLSLDRSETSPGGEVTGPAETGPAETAPPPARASGAPDVVRQGYCSGQSRSRLDLTDVGDKITVRFVVNDSLDHPWRFVLRHGRAGPDPFNYGDGRVFFSGTRVGRHLSPKVAVERSVGDREGDDGFAAKAVDQQTGQVCKARGVIYE